MSGSGTNVGVEYQQRIASLLLTYQYGEMDIAGLIGFPKPAHIEEVRFETDSPIDDIGVRCREKWRIDLQVKRAVSLSADNDSDFGKAIAQFVAAFVDDQQPETHFALVTTSDSSAKIRYELRKILESVRLNDSGFTNNPLSNRLLKNRVFRIRAIGASIGGKTWEVSPGLELRKNGTAR